LCMCVGGWRGGCTRARVRVLARRHHGNFAHGTSSNHLLALAQDVAHFLPPLSVLVLVHLPAAFLQHAAGLDAVDRLLVPGQTSRSWCIHAYHWRLRGGRKGGGCVGDRCSSFRHHGWQHQRRGIHGHARVETPCFGHAEDIGRRGFRRRHSACQLCGPHLAVARSCVRQFGANRAVPGPAPCCLRQAVRCIHPGEQRLRLCGGWPRCRAAVLMEAAGMARLTSQRTSRCGKASAPGHRRTSAPVEASSVGPLHGRVCTCRAEPVCTSVVPFPERISTVASELQLYVYVVPCSTNRQQPRGSGSWWYTGVVNPATQQAVRSLLL